MFSITVVITNWKRQKFIPNIIKQLAGQNYPKDKYEVIIVDDDTPNKDEVYSIIKEAIHKHDDIKFRFFETHKQVTLNPSLRYNVGARHSSNQIILLNESDILMQGEYLQQVNKNHKQDERLFLGPEVIHVHPGGLRKVETLRGICDLGAAIRKSHFHKVRGFDERTRGWGGIESDFGRRLALIGVHYKKDPEMKVLHQAIELCGLTAKEFFKDAAKVGPNTPQVGEVCNPETWGTLPSLEEIKF